MRRKKTTKIDVAVSELGGELKFFAAIVKNSEDAIVVHDLNGKIIVWNRGAERVYGYLENEMLGQSILNITPKELHAECKKIIADVKSGKSIVNGETQRITKNGRTLNIQQTIAPLSDDQGNVVAVARIGRDITERKLLEQKLYVASKEWQETFDSITDIVALISPNHEIIRINKAGHESLGKKPEELVGKKCYKIVHGLDVPIEGCPCVETLKTGKPGSGEISQGGRQFNVVAWPIFDENNKIKAFVHIVKDITEMKRVEDKIRHSNDVQTTINSLLSLSLKDAALDKIMKHALDLILSIPWLALESRGNVFLVEDEPNVLVMKAQNGLSEPIRKSCARVPFGRCLCGRAALKQEVQFSDHLDESHETRYEGIQPHGHYCVPILLEGRVLGVINLYLKEGHRHDKDEEEFLTAVANALASIVERKNFEKQQREFIYKANNISRGECYLLKSHNSAYNIFSTLALHDVPGICFSRKPEKMAKHSIPKERVILLSSTPLKGFETVDDIQQASMKISDFLRDNNGAVVLLDGLEYLISRSSFESVYKFIQEKRFNFVDAKATLLMPVDLAIFSDKEKALLTSEVKLLG
ncbi:MAG: PAS domain S-box protein [Methanobacteriota archaeon]